MDRTIEQMTDAEREFCEASGMDEHLYLSLSSVGPTVTYDEYEAARELAELARAESNG